MALENAQWIDELIATNPTAVDVVGQGDDHLRMLKVVLENTFVGSAGDIWDASGGPLLVGPGALNNLLGSLTLDPAIKTAPFAAADGVVYLLDSSGGTILVTLPATPDVGDRIGYIDYARTFGTNSVSWTSGELIEGDASDYEMDINAASGVLRYVDAIQGWLDTGGMA